VKRVAISGAAGFIGSHLCDRLLGEGYAVLGLDNFLTGAERNIAHLSGNPAFEFRRQDVTVPFAVEGPFDFVIHAASPASPKDYLAHPIETLDVGSAGTRNMLELAEKNGAKFLITSTSESYGDPAVIRRRRRTGAM
jgi:nucleoside-diphosphate-sugar epimerase